MLIAFFVFVGCHFGSLVSVSSLDFPRAYLLIFACFTGMFSCCVQDGMPAGAGYYVNGR